MNRVCCVVLVALFFGHWLREGDAGERQLPNIVLILADDLGARDLACDGADYHETPCIDKLASEGIRFTQAYAPAPVCTPTRASILTGKHPARLQMTIWSEGSINGPSDRKLLQAKSLHDLPLEEITLAEHLQQAGYLTAAVGKWHLGGAAHYPETQGFDVGIAGTHWGAPETFFFPYRGAGRFGSEFRYVPHLEFGRVGEYLTDRLTDEAIRVIDFAAASKRPFFLYLAQHAPHTPIEAKPDEVAYFERKLNATFRHRNPTYAAMIKSLDASVGRIRARLESLDIDSNTLMIFTSDNGGYIGQDRARSMPVTTNAPLRSGKGSLYEGGLRVPLIMRRAGENRAGQTREQPIVLTDLFHTILRQAGIEPQSSWPTDGLDLSNLLHDSNAALPRNEFYFHYPHYYHAPRMTPASAVRSKQWKMIEYFEDSQVELFDLNLDPHEESDLSTQYPRQIERLRKLLVQWRASVGAQMPALNPDPTR